MTEGTPLRLGVVGTGAIAQIVYVPIFREREDVTLAAMADRDPHKAETLSRRFGVPLVMDAEDILTFDELDAIVVCTPNALHEEQAIAALEAGKHVLVERPMALSAAGTQRVLDAAEASGKVLAVGMPHRFRPEVSALRNFVAGGELGEIYAVHGSWMTRTAPTMRSKWRQDPELAGGGALMDLGVAALDLCLWVVGFPEVKRISCVLASDDDEPVEHSATLMAETVNGMSIGLEVTNRLFAREERYLARVLGTEGSGSLPPLEVYKQVGGRPMDITPRQPKPRGGENPYMNAYRRLLDDFVRRIEGTAEAEPPFGQPNVMGLIEAAYRAAESGREVVL